MAAIEVHLSGVADLDFVGVMAMAEVRAVRNTASFRRCQVSAR